MVNSVDFTKRLEKLLEYYGLSATAFSEKVNFNRSTISHLLSGRNKPSLEFVMKVVNTFQEVDLYWLLNGKGSFPASTDTTKISKTVSQPDAQIRQAANATSNSENLEATTSLLSEETVKPVKTVERIIIFYKDGSFKEYLP